MGILCFISVIYEEEQVIQNHSLTAHKHTIFDKIEIYVFLSALQIRRSSKRGNLGHELQTNVSDLVKQISLQNNQT